MNNKPVDNDQALDLILEIQEIFVDSFRASGNRKVAEQALQKSLARLLQWGIEQYKKGYIDGGIAEIRI